MVNMSLARLVVTGVRLEGRAVSEVARDYGVSRQWIYTLLRRYDAEGERGLEPQSLHGSSSEQAARRSSQRPLAS
jgi:transposase